jgi:uncharacterized protein (TIGR00730 family)
MADLSDAFLALPGGYGTLDELFEILTWAQLGLHARPVGMLNVRGFFDPLLAWIDRAVEEGFLRPQHRSLLMIHDMTGPLLDALSCYRPAPETPKWIGRDDR